MVRPDIGGFSLLEAIIGIAVIAIVAGSIATKYPFDMKIMEKEATTVEVSLIARSIKDAIIIGARENYNPHDNSFSFIYEGVAVLIKLPSLGNTAHFPGDADDVLRSGENPGVTLGLYPAGLFYRGEVMKVYRFNTGLVELKSLTDEDGNPVFDSFTGPPLEEDGNLDGVFASDEDVNRNGFFDTFEDVGIDGLRDELEPGFDPVHNPDPHHDNFDPVNNPFGTERNGWFDAREPFSDTNGNGIRDSDESFTDGDMDGIFDGETDFNKNGYLDVPGRKSGPGGLPAPIKTYLQDPSLRSIDYGYTVRVTHQNAIGQDGYSEDSIFTFEIAVYKGFSAVRPALRSARQEVLDSASLPEADTGNMNDDDDDDVKDDKIVTDANHKIDRALTNGAALPENVLDGSDDDNDGYVDDGLVKPDFVGRFQIVFS
ncbi:MAG: hypothetical protein E3K32_05240 [wastewater metagenome]|nr:hypothetical protein [Candidatus Loosdrechtia aerotolerans]